jgi:L-fuculose-phosphate aldolase
MAHHGQVAMGASLSAALELAHEVEVLAEQYLKVLTLGPAACLSDAEMALVLEKFKTYGRAVAEE